MELVRRKIRGVEVEEPIFDSEEEFREYFKRRGEEPPEIVEDWRKGQVGDWVKSDDNRIVRIREERFWNNRRVVFTIIGVFNPESPKNKMDTDITKHPLYNSFSSKKKGHGVLQGLRKKGRNTRVSANDAKFIINLYVKKMPIEEAYRKAYGVRMQDSRKITQKLVQKIGERAVMSVLREEISKACNDLGIDPIYLLTKIKELIEGSKSDAVKLAALKEMMEVIGMKNYEERKLTGRLSIESPISGDEIAAIEAESRQVTRGALAEPSDE